ncbi:MAG: insulinase family protein [Bacteroidales bacterium]|jgi:predicted Zn-dependent peptidase|nr:insulinase family protein [Bacteroidales bacterium]
MIHYEKFTLENGLRVILNQDETTPLVAVNLLYAVGSKDEEEERTGFAHLFEHLMFSGTKNYPEFDKIIEEKRGETNAFTCNDYTNFYETLPLDALEVALALESDRMHNILISKKSLLVQQNVVIEEYKQRYLNQPYGDLWLLLRPLSYKLHPYKWSTIGKDISHIEKATLDDVEKFYNMYYVPNNAILSICGNIDFKEVRLMVEKYFGNIPVGKDIVRKHIVEPLQKEKRELKVKRDVPQNAIYITFPMASRLKKEYYAADLLSDILSNGPSSRLYNRLVKEKKLFTQVNASISGDMDEGLFILSGRYSDNITFEEGENALWEELYKIGNDRIEDREFQKVKNKFASTMLFSNLKILERAMNLCYFEFLDSIDRINQEVSLYEALEISLVQDVARKMFLQEKSNTLYYEKT